MMIPDFFIIGAPKCGTTSLSEYLRVHPNIFMSEPKEPNFFNKDLKVFVKTDEPTYRSLFRKADPAVHLAVGEASPGYLRSQCAVPDILAFNPRARFIVMLRDPVEMVQSLHSQSVFGGGETIRDFEEAWRAQEDRRAGRRIPWNALAPQNLYYSERCMLGEQMERLYGHVDRERVLVLLFDDLISDTRGVYERTLAFLGVPSDGRTDFPRFNENKRVRFLRLQPFLARAAAMASTLKMKLGIRKRTGLLGKMYSFNSGKDRRRPISDAFRAELREHFRPDVERLAALLGRDLSHWMGTPPR